MSRPTRCAILASLVFGTLGLSGCSVSGLFDSIALRLGEFSWAYEVILPVSGVDSSGAPLSSAEEYVPIPLFLTSDRVDYGAIRRDGLDIEISEATTGERLPFEIESWDSEGRSILWVRVPRVDPGDDGALLRLTYGRWDAPEEYTPQEVWSNGYVAVYHFAEGVPPFRDSTSFENHTTTMVSDPDELSAPDSIDGFVGKGVTFATNNAQFAGLRVPSSPSLSNMEAITAEFITDPGDDFGSSFLFFKNGVRLRLQVPPGSDMLKFEQNFQTIPAGAEASQDRDMFAEFRDYGLGSDGWKIGAVVWNGSSSGGEVRSFRNGIERGDTNRNSFAGSLELESNVDFDLIIGNGEAWGAGRSINGSLDEFRLSNVPRSSDWVAFQAAALQDRVVDWDEAEVTQLREVLDSSSLNSNTIR